MSDTADYVKFYVVHSNSNNQVLLLHSYIGAASEDNEESYMKDVLYIL